MFIFGVEVTKEFSIDYKVNGFNKSLMQRSNQTLVEKSPLKKKKIVCKKTICKKTLFTPIVNKFAITGVSNNIRDISNSSMTIQGYGGDYVKSSMEFTPGDDHAVDEEVGDKEVRYDDFVDSKWGKDGIEVGDDDGTNNEKDLEGDDNMGGVVDYDKDSDGKLSDCKSDDSPDEIDCWVDRNIDHTKRIKMKRKKVAKKVDGISSSPMQTRLQKTATPNSTNIQAKLKEKK
ncbi:hypothetical protein NE237_013414 [Protea cynaroides]|uniref:Uncharacterized protein n=1 Tax=Protea cynaroides TaxID=273540 RepID=A0A9Q0GYQ3_9MAGN|nr:hypothetical protein NE237_013414 [Protea cynaroides]